MAGRHLVRHQATEHVENSCGCNRQGAVEVSGNLWRGTFKIHQYTMLVDAHPDPDRDIVCALSIIIQHIGKCVITIRNDGQAVNGQPVRIGLKDLLLC